MALIICKNCGKKISDTVDICIHCGKNPKEEIEEVAAKAANELCAVNERTSKEEPVKEEKEHKTVDFNTLSENKQLKLEMEFWKEDKWSRNYIRSQSELFSFAKPIIVYPILFIIIIRLLNSFTNIFIEMEIINKTASIVAVISGILFVALCLGMLLYAILKPIFNIITHAKYKYYKRLQKWLKEKKNMSFCPKFITLRQKEIFEAIVIE